MKRWFVVCLLLALFMPAPVAGTVFKVGPINLGNGYVINGTIETDGTVGRLTPANFVKWNVAVTYRTDTIFTEQNTSAIYNLGVETDARRRMLVPTSPDGFSDGGTLNFLAAGGRGGNSDRRADR